MVSVTIVETRDSITVAQAAELLSVPRSRIQSAVREGRLCAARDGRNWRVLLDGAGRVVYRSDRLQSEWHHDLVAYIGSLSTPWPSELAERVGEWSARTVDVSDSASPRERELLSIIEGLRRDQQFQKIASETQLTDARQENARLQRHLDEERRRRELGVRSALLGLAAMIPAPDVAESQQFNLPVE